ncbi:actin related protein 2/3 complex, subunit 4, 20kDa [Zopfochytrium polystomum]|nr:actin related protein 2/3 complex, subunit 4, 20kDa [Zopfochytrium polystomum]
MAEGHNKPEVESTSVPVVVFIEPSNNAVRISFKIRKADDLERAFAQKHLKVVMIRAETYLILMRKPFRVRAEWRGIDMSFLVTNFHTEQMLKYKLADFVLHVIEVVSKEITLNSLTYHARARTLAKSADFVLPMFVSR